MPRTILAFAASNSNPSINRQLVDHAASVLADEINLANEIETLDISDFEMPIYSKAREVADGIPPQAQAFFDRLGAADGLIISFPEHNGGYPAAFKNLFDWASRIKMAIYQDAPAVFMAASPGKRAGKMVLDFATRTAPFFGANVVGSLGVGSFGEEFDTDRGALINPETAGALREALKALDGAVQDTTQRAAA